MFFVPKLYPDPVILGHPETDPTFPKPDLNPTFPKPDLVKMGPDTQHW